MKKLFAIVVLLALLIACKPEPVRPVVQPPQAEVNVNPPPVEVQVKTDSVEAKASEPSSGPQTVKVNIVKFAFNPSSVRIKVGDTVTWTQIDSVQHTVTVIAGPEVFDSGLLNAGQTYSHTFTKRGTYNYKCTPHPKMMGEVIVE